MMMSLYTAASGMGAQQQNIDTIANNLANQGTHGFKKMRLGFQDLMYQTEKPAGQTLASGGTLPVGSSTGMGTKVASTTRVMTQGVFQQTGSPLNIAIQGEGFMQVLLPNGTTAYTRDGNLQRDASGNLVTSDGYPLQPAVAIPADATQVIIGTDGKISVQQAGATQPNDIGQLTLARFPNTAGMQSIGQNLYLQTPASGTPTLSNPGTTGTGTVSQGFLEMSNVQVVEEMVNMMTAQRAYEINSKVIQGADRMLGILANLKQ
ncbi:MAG: flagellar basal-body rod protein FlgG [Proteobacteria bacterium]|nr:flagellar basal-body rod protein FlgG [Pseudomonadota bacterium]